MIQNIRYRLLCISSAVCKFIGEPNKPKYRASSTYYFISYLCMPNYSKNLHSRIKLAQNIIPDTQFGFKSKHYTFL